MYLYVDVGSLISETVDVLRQGLKGVVLYGVILGLITFGGVSLGIMKTGGGLSIFNASFLLETGDGLLPASANLAMAALDAVLSCLLVRHMLQLHVLPVGEARIGAFLGLSVVWLLGIALGLTLLIVPGVIFMTRCCAAPGFLLGSRKGVFESLKASWEATSGIGWTILGAFIGVSLILSVLMLLIAGAFAAVTKGWSFLIITSLAQPLITAVQFAFAVAIYNLVGSSEAEIEGVFA